MAQAIKLDRERYISMQSEHIGEWRRRIEGKLYFEMGGRLFDDMYTSRVFPGLTPDNEIAILEKLRNELEIVVAVNANLLTKVRVDLGTSYQEDVPRLMDVPRERGFPVENVVFTRMEDDNTSAKTFKRRMERLGLRAAQHRRIKEYPGNTKLIVSGGGFGKSDYVETSRDLIAVTASGPGSGKLATCLLQFLHENRRGIEAGYARFETFPIQNLPLGHPINVIYKVIMADLEDANLIDPFHLQACDEQVVSYNRDVEVFPLSVTLLRETAGESLYQSPMDMGVSIAGHCISGDVVYREAGEQGVIRRYYRALVDERRTEAGPVVSGRIALITGWLGLAKEDRVVVEPMLRKAKAAGGPVSITELPSEEVIAGKTSGPPDCSATMLLNAFKILARIRGDVDLLAHEPIELIRILKTEHLGSRNPRLHTDEMLIALSVSTMRNDSVCKALDELRNPRDYDAHTTAILGSVDEGVLRNPGVLVASESVYQRRSLHHKRQERREGRVRWNGGGPSSMAQRRPDLLRSPAWRGNTPKAESP